MMEEKLITTREASTILGLSEQEVIDLVNAGELASIKMAGEYLRYRKSDIIHKKEELKRKASSQSSRVRVIDWREFFYFYDFYIICAVIILVLLWLIFFGRYA